MNDLYKQQLIPRQKDAFLCSARCCDSSNDMGDLQKWWALVLDWLSWHACCHRPAVHGPQQQCIQLACPVECQGAAAPAWHVYTTLPCA